MALTWRQKHAYLDEVEVWKHDGHSAAFKLDTNGTVINIVYSQLGSPDRTGVTCLLLSRKEGNIYERPIGRTAFDNIFTLDVLRVEVTDDLEDQDVVKVTTADSPFFGEYFIMQGEGSARRSKGIRQGNFKSLQLKRSNAPQTVGGT